MSSTAILTAYAVGALVLSLGAQIAHDLVGSENTLISGAAISLFAVVWGIVGLLAKRLPSRLAMMLGGFASATGMALLALSATEHSLTIFFASIAVTGGGYSLLFLGGLSLINDHAPAHHRGGTFSALYLIAYVMQGLVALLLGAVATTWGLEVATDLGSIAIAMLSIIVIALPLLIDLPVRISA
jgi:MFS family permease